MKKKFIIFSLFSTLLLLISPSIFASYNYNSKFKEAESLLEKQNPKSALAVVAEIKEQALKDKNKEQYIKSILFYIKTDSILNEFTTEKRINSLIAETTKSEFPEKALLQNITAKVIWNYYNMNRFRFAQRSEIEGFVPEDIATWSLGQLIKEVNSLYKSSIEQANELQKISVSDYSTFLVKGNDDKIRTTLYDVLAGNALDFYSNGESGITEPVYAFVINKNEFFLPSEQFVKYDIKAQDKSSMKYQALQLFQFIENRYILSKNRESLYNLALKRLKFCYDNSVSEDKEKSFEESLNALILSSKGTESESEAAYEIAAFYYKQSQNIAKSAEEQKSLINKSLEIANKYSFFNNIGGNNCKYLIEQINQKSLSLTVANISIPNEDIPVTVNYKNIDKLYFKIVKFSPDEIFSEESYLDSKQLEKLKSSSGVKEWEIKFDKSSDKLSHIEKVSAGKLPSDDYILFCGTDKSFSNSSGKGFSYGMFSVKSIAYINKVLPNGKTEVYFFDRKSGKPLKDITVSSWSINYDYSNNKRKVQRVLLSEKVKSDENGYALITNSKSSNDSYNNYLKFEGSTEIVYTDSFYNRVYEEQNQERVITTIFTDRSIYRPGQIVYFKGISVKSNGLKASVIPNQSSTVYFYDVNGSLIESKTLKTNDFGSFSDSFTIPKGVLNGVMRIKSGNGEVQISVEEYKRPKFEVKFEGSDTEYKLGDKVTIKGKASAYAGFPISDAEVKYTVRRKALYPDWFYYWFPAPPSSETAIAFGSAKTDDKGEFSITFDAVPDKSINKSDNPYFRYEISADVTDINGETRSASSSISAGYSALQIKINGQNSYDKESAGKVFISTENFNGKKINSVVTIKISKLKDSSNKEISEFKTPSFNKEKELFSQTFDTSKNSELTLDFSAYPLGKYVVEAETKDKFGEKVTASSEFTLYSSKSTEVPYKTTNWFFVPKSSAVPNDKVKVIFGSSEEVWAVMEKECRGVISDRKIVHLNNKQEIFEIPVTENERGNFAVRVTFIKNNKIYNNEAIITVPWSNKSLDIKYETFRDKLQPGENEEYRIIISGQNGEKVGAEIVASMYDASLDYFKPHSWYGSFYNYFYPTKSWTFGSQFNSVHLSSMFNWYPKLYLKNRQYTVLNDFNLAYFQNEFGKQKRVMMAKSMAMDEAMPVMAESNDMEMKKEAVAGQVAAVKEEVKKESTPSVVPRTNLNETVFFYPNLKTDENGRVIISFKSGEALTRWKMLLFAHTKDMKYGFSEKEVTTSKDVMVTPNIPRFFREGDTVYISTKVSNMTSEKLGGKVKLELFNAETMTPLNKEFSVENSEQDYQIEQNSSSSFSWKLSIPENISAVAVRIIADSGKKSDGEESIIPVLTDRMMVTDTISMSVRAGKEKEFTFKNLLNQSATQKPYKLTFEWSSNPAWYAVQSLPYLTEYPYECSEQVFSRIYANSVSSLILSANPEIERIYKLWQEKGDELISNLEKNQELKQILLQETPWVMEAKTETEQKRRIAILFDKNRVNSEKESAIKKLQEKQYGNGGFPWFKGMEPNKYITTHITAGFGKMKKMGISEDSRVTEMMKKSVSYLDYNMNRVYNDIKEKKRYHISYSDIHYLYARSFYLNSPVSSEYKESYNYFLNHAKLQWRDGNKYMQAMTAIALYRNGEIQTAKEIMKSIKEYALESEELGMWWKSEGYGFYWHEAKIEKQSMMIEAFSEIASNPEDIESMKVWLLKNKQTNSWETTKATVEAVYALLMNGTKLLSETKTADIKLGSKNFDEVFGKVEDKNRGTGYFKSSLNSDKVKSEYGKVNVKNDSKTVQWGAMYYQYFEKLENIGKSTSGVNISKKLFIERDGDKGKYIVPVDEKNPIKIGDKVKVRIEIRSDRDMEFVHLKDMRGAGFEPLNTLSTYKYQDGLGYYEETKDSSQNFFFDYLPKGTHIFEYPLSAFNAGNFSAGIATMQCMYAPEFSSHSEGIRVRIE